MFTEYEVRRIGNLKKQAVSVLTELSAMAGIADMSKKPEQIFSETIQFLNQTGFDYSARQWGQEKQAPDSKFGWVWKEVLAQAENQHIVIQIKDHLALSHVFNLLKYAGFKYMSHTETTIVIYKTEEDKRDSELRAKYSEEY